MFADVDGGLALTGECRLCSETRVCSACRAPVMKCSHRDEFLRRRQRARRERLKRGDGAPVGIGVGDELEPKSKKKKTSGETGVKVKERAEGKAEDQVVVHYGAVVAKPRGSSRKPQSGKASPLEGAIEREFWRSRDPRDTRATSYRVVEVLSTDGDSAEVVSFWVNGPEDDRPKRRKISLQRLRPISPKRGYTHLEPGSSGYLDVQRWASQHVRRDG